MFLESRYAVSDYRTLLYEEIIKKKKKLRKEQKAKIMAKQKAMSSSGLQPSPSTRMSFSFCQSVSGNKFTALAEKFMFPYGYCL